MEAVIKILAGVLLFQANLVASWDIPRLADEGEFPFHAAIMWKPSSAATHFTSCGGCILNSRWILTSAYCVAYVPDLGFNYVKVGNQDVKIDDDRVQIHQIERLIVHEKYPGRSPQLSHLAYYDIGLIKLRSDIVFNDFVKAIKLPKPSGWATVGQRSDYNFIMSGYGVFAYHLYPEKPTMMRKVTLPVVPNRVCTDNIRHLFPNFQMGDMQMCTRPLDGNISGCIGNWGGPLIRYNSESEPVVVGIVGWANVVCNTNNIPPVYTRVSYFVNWINKKISQKI